MEQEQAKTDLAVFRERYKTFFGFIIDFHLNFSFWRDNSSGKMVRTGSLIYFY